MAEKVMFLDGRKIESIKGLDDEQLSRVEVEDDDGTGTVRLFRFGDTIRGKTEQVARTPDGLISI